MKNLILRRYEPNKFHYTEDDYKTFQQICHLTGYKPKTHSKLYNKIEGRSAIFTTIKDAQQRLLHCIGEIKAGNNE